MTLAGIDIGGTKIGVCVGDPEGRVLGTDRITADPGRPPAEVLAWCVERIEAMRSEIGAPALRALGVACPGPLSYADGKFLDPPNMPAWHGFEIAAWLRERAPVAARYMNDANASVLAEATWGAARGADTAIFLTMSTGMGAGLWLGGRVFEGPHALAGEIGHLRLRDDGPVGFGKRGSAEGYLSGPGIVQVARAEVAAFEQRGVATELAHTEITPETVCELARGGDPAAIATIDRCGHELGRLCAILVDVLDPEVIVLGTIGTAAFDLFAPRALRVLESEAITGVASRVALRPSGLADRGDQTALAVATLI